MENLIISEAVINRVALLCAALLLAYEPSAWLITSWTDPAYDSSGWLVFLLCVGLITWSVSSPTTNDHCSHPRAYALFWLTAILRLVGIIYGVNIIGACALVVDVYALGLLLNLHLRTRTVAPSWLAACFFFSLPLERVLQRTIGYGLQHISALGASQLLSGLYNDVHLQGVRILVSGKDVLVDLPCSGARSLLLLLLLFCALACIQRFSVRRGAMGLLLVLVTCIAVNSLRITLLGIGIASPALVGGINVMEQPWHDLFGYLSLTLGCVPLILLSKEPENRETSDSMNTIRLDDRIHAQQLATLTAPPMFLLIALGVVLITPLHREGNHPQTSSNTISNLPSRLLEQPAQFTTLHPREALYFTTYGGRAQKARYGDFNLMTVTTDAPLRHLHTPDECLRGLGFSVTYLGLDYQPYPTARYKAIAPDGTSYAVAVTFISNRGLATTNVSEAIWHWMSGTHTRWTAIQRISPWNLEDTQMHSFDSAVFAAMDFTPNNYS